MALPQDPEGGFPGSNNRLKMSPSSFTTSSGYSPSSLITLLPGHWTVSGCLMASSGQCLVHWHKINDLGQLFYLLPSVPTYETIVLTCASECTVRLSYIIIQIPHGNRFQAIGRLVTHPCQYLTSLSSDISRPMFV